MEENRKVNVSQSPSLQVVLVKGGLDPSRDGCPWESNARCCRMDQGEGLCRPPCGY